jgi:hypothetical protein
MSVADNDAGTKNCEPGKTDAAHGVLPEENAGELARHDPAHGPQIFGVKLVSRVADWAGFSGYAVF